MFTHTHIYSIPIFDEIVLSLSNMNSIISFDARSGVVVCEAGHILQVYICTYMCACVYMCVYIYVCVCVYLYLTRAAALSCVECAYVVQDDTHTHTNLHTYIYVMYDDSCSRVVVFEWAAFYRCTYKYVHVVYMYICWGS